MLQEYRVCFHQEISTFCFFLISAFVTIVLIKSIERWNVTLHIMKLYDIDQRYVMNFLQWIPYTTLSFSKFRWKMSPLRLCIPCFKETVKLKGLEI